MRSKRRILAVQLLSTYLLVVLHSGVAHCHALPHDTHPHEHHTHHHAHEPHAHHHAHEAESYATSTGLLHFFVHLFDGIAHMHAQADHPVLAARKAVHFNNQQKWFTGVVSTPLTTDVLAQPVMPQSTYQAQRHFNSVSLSSVSLRGPPPVV